MTRPDSNAQIASPDRTAAGKPEDRGTGGEQLVLTPAMSVPAGALPPLVLGSQMARPAKAPDAASHHAINPGPAKEAEDPQTDAVLDESALREMIAEIVREELRGALGARATSNIRKLVRREILRAFAMHDLG